MKKLPSLGVVAIVAMLAMLGFSPEAQAYPDERIDLTVNRQVLYGGQSFTATATAHGTTCAWNLEWAGMVRESDDSRFVTKFRAAEVSKITKIPLRGTCIYPSSSSRAAATWQQTITITVLPPSSAVSPPASADLPNAGGPDFIFLLGGLALLLTGATAVTVARRRAEEADIAAFQA